MCVSCRKVLIRAYKGKSLIGLLIRWQTRSPYSHIALQFGDMIVESHANTGVVSRYVQAGDEVADVFSVEVTEDSYRRMLEWCLSHVGDKYDWLAILRFISRKRCWSDVKWFCSELAYAAFQHVGINLLVRTEAWEVSPGMLVRSPLLQELE